MYGSKKKIIIIVLLVILIPVTACGAFFFLNKKDSRLQIKYIGGDKYVDEQVSSKDFKVIDKKTNKEIPTNKFKVSAEPLNIDGTTVTIIYNLSGQDYTGTIKVYPTLVVKSITAELTATNKHIGSKISKEDFKVIGTNNKNKKVELKDFSLSHTTLKNAENNVKIEYKTSVGTVSTTLQINVTENFIKGVEAKYTGPQVFIGEDVDEENFEVYAIWDDDTKTKFEDYDIEDTTLTNDITVLQVSITDDLGKTFFADVKIKALNYVTDIDHVTYIGQEQTIGNKVEKSDFEVYGIYYDGSIQKIENYKFLSSTILKKDKNTIQIGLTNEIGDSITYNTVVNAEVNIIYVGDSRIKGLDAYMHSEDKTKYEDRIDKCYYVYTDNADLKWFNETGKNQVQSILDKNPYTTFRIVISLGSFDFDNMNKYVDVYKKLAKSTWKKQRIYIDSINPVDEAQMEQSKTYSRDNINTNKINDFNKNINADISKLGLSNLKYINSYGSLANSDFKTTDGYNYTNETYDMLHESVKQLSM